MPNATQRNPHRPADAHRNNTLKMAFWNACGLQNKTTELEFFMKQHEIDIMMVTESRSPRSSNPLATTTSSHSIEGYLAYSANHPSNRKKGGVITFVKGNLQHIGLQPIEEDFLQSSPILINTSKTEEIVITPIYCPPTLSWSTEHFTKLFKHYKKLSKHSKFIICGDWNAKHPWWGNTRSCPRGRSLLEAVHSSQLLNILATGGATHYPFDKRKLPSAIDFAIYSGICGDRLHTYSETDLHSDHLPVLIELSICGRTEHKPHSRKLLPPGANIKKFQEVLAEATLLNTEINNQQDIDDAIEIFNRNIYHAAKIATRHIKTSNRNPTGQFLLDRKLLNLQAIKKYTKQIKMARQTPEAAKNYKAANERFLRAIKEAKTKRTNNILNKIDPLDRYRMQKLWKITNHFKRQPEPNWPLKLYTGDGTSAKDWYSWTKSSEEKTEAFTRHLEERFSPKLTNSESFRAHVISKKEEICTQKLLMTTPCWMHRENYGYNSDKTNLPFLPITPNEVLAEIKLLQNKKAPGPDQIDNKLIKLLPHKATLHLTHIYNCMLRYSYFPKQWKRAAITMIKKPGKTPHEVSSYRPISLLPGFSKIFETLLMHRMFKIQDFERAIPSHQFGFRKQHSTEQQLLRVTQHILSAYEQKMYCSAVFIDVSEAFDRVWHDGLLLKLAKLLPHSLYKILQSYLTDRSFTMNSTNGIPSRTGKISAGVPQGSVLGPILYTVFTSDMP